MDQTPQYQQGLAELKAGRIAEARRLFDANEAALGTAAETRSMLERAEAGLERGDLAKAAPLLDEVIRRNPGLPEGYVGLARVALVTQQLDAARTHARAATTVAPQLGMGWTLLGLIHELEGDAQGAHPLLEKGAKLSPQIFLCQLNHGRLLAASGQATSAVSFLQRAVELEPTSGEAQLQLGYARSQAGQPDRAIEALRRATELSPQKPETWGVLSDVLFGTKAYAEARRVLDAGMEKAGPHPALLEKATACALALDDVAGAVAYVERELTVVPEHEQGWLNLATFTLLTKQLDRSEEAARALLRLNPKRWEAWLHLGDLYDAKSEEAQAHAAYREALKLAPEQWKLLMNFGAALVQTQDAASWREGRELLLRAVRHAPAGEWRPHYNLALAHVRLGERAEALALAQRVQHEAPNTPIAAEAKKLEANLRAQS